MLVTLLRSTNTYGHDLDQLLTSLRSVEFPFLSLSCVFILFPFSFLFSFPPFLPQWQVSG